MAGTTPRLPTGHYRLIVENSPVMIWRSGLDGKCDYFNQVWLVTGRRLEEEIGDGWATGVHPDDVSSMLASTWTISGSVSRFRWNTG
jgi:PAS domain S-box-containing protein